MNIAAQTYVASITILSLPFHVELLGAEAYGLVGVFASLQILFSLIDLGLTPTIARQSSRFNAAVITLIEYRQIIFVVEVVFAAIAIAGGGVLFILADVIAQKWLTANSISHKELGSLIQLMAIIVAIRWFGGIYRGIMAGSEKVMELALVNCLVASARFIFVLPVLKRADNPAEAFFNYQLCVACVELFVLIVLGKATLPTLPTSYRMKFSFNYLRSLWTFFASIGFTSAAWIAMAQADKVILTKILSLSEYGLFTVATMLAAGVMSISTPIGNALMPRLARVHAAGKNEEVCEIYRKATRLTILLVFPVGLLIAVFAEEVLWIWTGDAYIAAKVNQVLTLYTIGNLALVVAAFPYYLQYAIGDLRLHVSGNSISLILMIPSMVVASAFEGMRGTAWVWMASNVAYLLLWVPVIHRKFVSSIAKSWSLRDVAAPTLLQLVFVLLMVQNFNFSVNRFFLMVEMTLVLALIFALTFIYFRLIDPIVTR